MMRDTAWLSKKVHDSPYTSYYIEDTDELTVTLLREMAKLFPQCERSNQEDSSLQFKLVEIEALGKEGFEILHTDGKIIVQANTTNGLLYGMFQLHQDLVTKNELKPVFRSVPDQAVRMLNHWDNFDGSVERGYAGDSLFYDNNQFRKNYDTIREYARLLKAIGINALTINNVNVHKEETFFITQPYLSEVKAIAEIFKEYGLTLYLSINFAAPISVGGLTTADPLDEDVNKFWADAANEIYAEIPYFGGFVVKADSEGEPGPFVYDRNHDDGANMLARALQPHGGIVIWRCFVYNHLQDWRDRSIDRARAAYDNFMPLDGNFDDNVILQIKNGPLDFQVREPVSPLFGGLTKTNHVLEFQVAQEYTGQQKHVCYLMPMWKDVLDFDTKHHKENATVKELLPKNSPNIQRSGISAVVNVGIDNNWTGHKLAQVNLYGYGKLIWNNAITSEEVLDQWLDLTFDLTPKGKEILTEIIATSYQTYENYTAPLGIGFMVRPNHHYGPDIDGYEYDRWGTYHFADRNGIGVNRTLKDGTGYARQYADARFEEYENIETCPDDIVLFFHHLPYTHVLHSGKTVVQHIYDTHFEGYEKVEEYVKVWEQLKDEVDEASYNNVRERLAEQKRCALEWRDQINTYFYRKSGIADEHKRQIYG